jgi:hypothetical protein
MQIMATNTARFEKPVKNYFINSKERYTWEI